MKLKAALFLLLLTTVAFADPSPKHLAWCHAAVYSLPRFNEDPDTESKRAELDAISIAVAKYSIRAPRPPREWASLILMVWNHESHLSSRIIANDCKPKECDGGRARGGGQVHKNSLNGAEWDAAPGNIDIQVKMTSDSLKHAFLNCSKAGVAWDMGTIASYAGKGCSFWWPGGEARLATFDRLKRVSIVKAPAN